MFRPAMAFPFDPRRLLSALLVISALAAGPVTSAWAQSTAKGEYRAEAVRAVFLLNFVRFTEWPFEKQPDDDPFVVGVAGNRLLEDELIGLVKDMKVRSRLIHVKRIKTTRDLEGCHLLYISPVVKAEEEPAPGAAELMPHVRGRPVLTVSESSSFLAGGGVVNLYSAEGGSLRFEIAPEAAKTSGLTLSSRLLALARIVNPPETGPKP